MHALATAGLPQVLRSFPFLLRWKDAWDFLEQLDECITLLHLYRHYFPDAFFLAQQQGLSLTPTTDETYGPYEKRFFQLVDERLFPLPLDILLDDPFGTRQMAHMVPILPMGFDYDYDLYEESSFGWHLLLYLIDERDEEFLRAYGLSEDDALFDVSIARGRRISGDLLETRCLCQGGPLQFLPLALDMLYHCTESVWLNVTGENPYTDVRWTIREVDSLRRQYVRAKDIRANVETFCIWLEEQPLRHFSQVAHLWNACQARTSSSDQVVFLLPAHSG